MENIVSFIGAFLKHIIGVLLLCWRRMLRAGLVAFAIGVILVLLVAVISTGQAYPGALALAVALIFGGALAYGVALTVFIEELALGVVDLIHLLEGDAKAVAHLTETMAEREVGEVAKGLGRLIGLPMGKRAAPPPLPTLPALPRYPAARPSAAPTPQREAFVRDTAIAGAAALASTAVASVVSHHQPAQQSATQAQTPAQAAATPPASSAPAVELIAQAATETPSAAPVRADHLPRIGWTYEHEAIRPVRPAEPPDTLAELADVAVAGAGVAGAAQVASEAATVETPAPAESVALEPPAIAEAPATEPSGALDVAVVSATALGPYGQAAEPATIATASDAHGSLPDASEASAPTPAVATSDMSDVSDDIPALDDERLAEPVALAIPDEPPSDEPPPDEPLASSRAAEEEMGTSPALAAADLVVSPVEPMPAAEPEAPHPSAEAEPTDAEPLDTEMLKPAPATTPLRPDAEPLDLAMLTPVPATVPLPMDEEPAPEPYTAEEPTALVNAPSYASDESDESDESDHASTTEDAVAPAPVAFAISDAPDAPDAPDASEAAAPIVEEATQPEVPPARSIFSRITKPVVDIETTLDALGRIRSSSGPRASAPESGLWERLSQALIDRSGAPASPFSAPQNRPPSPDAHTASEGDETPQA